LHLIWLAIPVIYLPSRLLQCRSVSSGRVPIRVPKTGGVNRRRAYMTPKEVSQFYIDLGCRLKVIRAALNLSEAQAAADHAVTLGPIDDGRPAAKCAATTMA